MVGRVCVGVSAFVLFDLVINGGCFLSEVLAHLTLRDPIHGMVPVSWLSILVLAVVRYG